MTNNNQDQLALRRTMLRLKIEKGNGALSNLSLWRQVKAERRTNIIEKAKK